ncbi:uncharacterized protein si:ch211-191i18.2 isoform X1 [Sander lucioperca]|uniref:uncharacterized protein si:ch211-191i18.2 isoform X1 n=1 Tax=Sander lucioperca TaxID=283035 RepID=UPI00165362B0|nr:uncharacterized protein si:ch211-191i18.2 isoform X1 [Sander lucioperca]XP_035848913.1 uncharacterized protein si:ch211-191i18.2 isoform X1 [Sander lucioperca]XP_035848914.1 uncharacterized protein si:ch211-191i18.2 isoform X1 [Sander lucioperca]XP_035848915.1 uncharacterized protein si:ch211-191i18.2 isoform X1 [Sander lucioperca]
MSSLSLLYVYLSALILLLLPAVSEAQYYDLTPAPDYDDYNATFDYSFYSNASSEDLDKFSERFIDPEDEDQQEDTGGSREGQEVTVTMATTPGTTEQGWVDGRNSASLPVSLDMKTLVWVILISLNLQLQHTL